MADSTSDPCQAVRRAGVGLMLDTEARHGGVCGAARALASVVLAVKAEASGAARAAILWDTLEAGGEPGLHPSTTYSSLKLFLSTFCGDLSQLFLSSFSAFSQLFLSSFSALSRLFLGPSSRR